MSRVWAVVIAAVLLWSSVPLRADETPVSLLDGRWIYDAARSRVLDPDLKITRTATGSLRVEGLGGIPLEFNPVGGSTWNARTSKDAFTLTLSGNTLRNVTQGKLPNGLPYEHTTTYRREGKGEGGVGLWRSVKVDTGSTWDEFVFSVASDGVVTWRIPTDLQVITGRFDGSDLALVGPKGPTGSTIAIEAVGPRRFDYVIKNGAQTRQHGSITVSRDRRRLTDLSWDVDQPTRKSALVYEREVAPD